MTPRYTPTLGADLAVGMTYRDHGRLYTINHIDRDHGREGTRLVLREDSAGVTAGLVTVWDDSKYQVRDDTPVPPARITQAKARRLVDAMEAIRACQDITTGLSIALDDARREISPWYDR